MGKAERYEEHRRRMDEILTQAEVNARRNMWQRAAAAVLGGAAGYALVGTASYTVVLHHPWSWASAGLRAGLWILFSSLIWAGLMVWDRRTNPLRHYRR